MNWSSTTDDLTRDIRRWLARRPEPDPVIATALAYELAALIARHADSQDEARALVEYTTRVMVEQIAAFGVGREHP